MAEQNILAGNIKVLEQVIGDVKEHSDKTALLGRLNISVQDINKQIDTAKKNVQDEIDGRIKSSTDAICAGYDKSINSSKEKLKTVQAERDKAKMAGVKERIDSETASLRTENDDLMEQINEAFIQENISKIFNSRIFLALFQSKGIADGLIYAGFLLLFYVGIPAIGYFIPAIPVEGVLLYYVVMIVILTSVRRFIYEKKLIPNIETISAAHNTKIRIRVNKERIKKIKYGIKKDQNEEMYGLDVFDDKMRDLYDEINKIESEKKSALDEFEKTVKSDIIMEVKGQNAQKIEDMENERQKKSTELMKVDELVNKQRIYISSNYEAYLGKDFINSDKLQELYSIMKSGAADTIGQAMAAYRNRH